MIKEVDVSNKVIYISKDGEQVARIESGKLLIDVDKIGVKCTEDIASNLKLVKLEV